MTILESLPLWVCVGFMFLGCIAVAAGVGFGVLSLIGRPVRIRFAGGLLVAGLAVFLIAAVIYLQLGGVLIIGPATFGGAEGIS